MESEAVALLRARALDLDTEIASLRAHLLKLQDEQRQIDAGIRAMTGVLLTPSGSEASRQSIIHHARLANPDADKRTIKQLVLQALRDKFLAGATSSDFLDYFARELGRDDIVRTSLSPQLSRLRYEGKIRRVGRTWHLSDSYDALTGGKDTENGDAVEAEPDDRDEGAATPSHPHSDLPIPREGDREVQA